jgi:hypothetical protein
MTDRKGKGKDFKQFKIPAAGVNFYKAVLGVATDFSVKKLYKMAGGSDAHAAGITSPEITRKGITKRKGSIYERCRKCNAKSQFCMCDRSNYAAGAEKMSNVGGKMLQTLAVDPTSATVTAPAGKGEFVALSQRPKAIALKAKLDRQNALGNVFDLPPEQWKISFETPIKLFIEDEIKEARLIPKELQNHLRLLEKHKKMYDQTMKDVRLDPVFPKLTALLEEVRERVQAKSATEYDLNGGKPYQSATELQQLYNEGREVEERYTKLMKSLARKSKCKYIPAPKKGVIRCYEKMGLKITQQWDASCLTDIVRGALEMPAGQVGKGKQALQILQGFARDEMETDTAFESALSQEDAEELDIVIVDVKNRWNISTDGGWCDALVTFYFHTDINQHICEIQLVHEQMMSVRSEMDAHRAYGVYRSAFELLEATGESTVLEAPKTCEQRTANGKCTRQALPGPSSLQCKNHTCKFAHVGSAKICTNGKSSSATFCDAHSGLDPHAPLHSLPRKVDSKFVVPTIRLGHPTQAAAGLADLMGFTETTINHHIFSNGGDSDPAEAMINEINLNGTPTDKNNLRGLLDGTYINPPHSNGDPPTAEEVAARGKTIAELMETEQAKTGKLIRAHVLALRLYTTSTFASINNPLRTEPATQPHPLAITVHYASQGIKMLRAVAGSLPNAHDPLDFYRGMKDVTITEEFLKTGGTEFAPISTSESLAVAIDFADSDMPLIIKLQTKDFMSRGADIAFLSVYPGETETLFPPLTFLRPIGSEKIARNGKTYVQVRCEPVIP